MIGFVGVLIMLMPHLNAGALVEGLSGGPAVGALFALLGAFCSAGATIQVRRLLMTEKTGAIVLGWHLPGPADATLLVVIGILGGIGQILLTQSFRYADASLIAPFEYTTMLWAFLIGWFAFAQAPQEAVIVGAGIVAAAGLFVLWREHRLGLMRAKDVETSSQRPA